MAEDGIDTTVVLDRKLAEAIERIQPDEVTLDRLIPYFATSVNGQTSLNGQILKENRQYIEKNGYAWEKAVAGHLKFLEEGRRIFGNIFCELDPRFLSMTTLKNVDEKYGTCSIHLPRFAIYTPQDPVMRLAYLREESVTEYMNKSTLEITGSSRSGGNTLIFRFGDAKQHEKALALQVLEGLFKNELFAGIDVAYSVDGLHVFAEWGESGPSYVEGARGNIALKAATLVPTPFSSETRKNIKETERMFGYALIIADTPSELWQASCDVLPIKHSIETYDPLVVGIRHGRAYLTHEYNTTSLEQWVRSEMTGQGE